MVTTRANRRKASIARRHSIHRPCSSDQRQTTFETLRERQIHKKSSRQASFRQPKASKGKVVVLKLPVKPDQAPLTSTEPSNNGENRKHKAAAAPRQWAVPKRIVKRQLSTPDPSSSTRPRPTQVQRPTARLEPFEAPIGPPPRPRHNQPVANKPASRPALSVRRGLTLRLADDTPVAEQVVREIWKQRDVPLDIEGMSEEERANFLGAVEDGTWKVGFNESQLGWAALIANGKPPGMDVGSEPSPHSQHIHENEADPI